MYISSYDNMEKWETQKSPTEWKERTWCNAIQRPPTREEGYNQKFGKRGHGSLDEQPLKPISHHKSSHWGHYRSKNTRRMHMEEWDGVKRQDKLLISINKAINAGVATKN